MRIMMRAARDAGGVMAASVWRRSASRRAVSLLLAIAAVGSVGRAAQGT